ncbi:MAG: hypothetical protein AAF629_30435 [Chloroflexota bacterium]
MPDETASFYPYHPRKVTTDLGIWEAASRKFKVYGILADGQEITKEIIENAKSYVFNDSDQIIGAGPKDDGLGFIIIHPGELGVSVLIHWWSQGSVLCQHVRRWVWGSDVPLDMSSQHVLGCVWELGLINAEQLIWRDTMMVEPANSNEYLANRPAFTAV